MISHFTNLNIKTFKQKKMWKDIKNFEELRNKIIHYKERNNVKRTIRKAKECNELICEIIKFISKKLK